MSNVLQSIAVVASLSCSILFGIANPTTAAEPTWRAGVAQVKITPEKLIWMSGYGSRKHPAEGKLTDLWCKVLLIEDSGGNRAVLISLDLVGIDRTLSQSVCQQLERQYELSRQQIAICTSHTHTGPVVG